MAIDPGASGAIVSTNTSLSLTVSRNMPGTEADICEEIRRHCMGGGNVSPLAYPVVIENVGAYVSGDAATSACKFAKHCGVLEGIMTALSIPFDRVAPQVWMKAYVGKIAYPKRCDNAGKKKTYRKNVVKARSQQLFPSITVTLANADALGMLWFAMEKRRG